MYEKTYNRSFKNVLASGIDLDFGDGKYYCLTDGFVRLARQLLQELSERPFYFYGAIGVGTFTTVSKAQFDTVQAVLAEGLGELMSGCDIEAQLDCICTAIQEQTAVIGAQNLGSGYAGPTAEPPSENVDNGVDAPPGFSSYAEYQTHKCNAAETILSNLVSDITYLRAAGQIGGFTIGLIAGILTPIPGDELFVAIAFLAASLFVGDQFYAEFLAVLNDTYDDLLCSLFEAGDVSSVQASFITTLNDSPHWVNSYFQSTAVNLAQWWMNFTNINLLFEVNTVRTLETGDCSGCAGVECALFHLNQGTVISIIGNVLTVASELATDGQGYRVSVSLYATGQWAFCGGPAQVKSVSTDVEIYETYTGLTAYQFKEQDQTTVYASNDPPPPNFNGIGRIVLRNQVGRGPFVATIHIN